MTTQIEVAELKVLHEQGLVKIVDGSWALDGTDMRALYEVSHIPGAVFFDIESISDQSSGLPHMAPTPEQFESAVSAMGISFKDHVVVYDQQGLFSAARVWWTFKLMGHEHVQVLKGGLPTWIGAGYETTTSHTLTTEKIYKGEFNENIVININSLSNFSNLIFDARSNARFTGAAQEPRAGLRSGHIPGSISLPFTEVVRDGELKPRAELEAIFGKYDLASRPVVTSCGSGVTAAILSMALYEIGYTDVRLYDGSWAEWGQESLDTPVVTGAH